MNFQYPVSTAGMNIVDARCFQIAMCPDSHTAELIATALNREYLAGVGSHRGREEPVHPTMRPVTFVPLATKQLREEADRQYPTGEVCAVCEKPAAQTRGQACAFIDCPSRERAE